MHAWRCHGKAAAACSCFGLPALPPLLMATLRQTACWCVKWPTVARLATSHATLLAAVQICEFHLKAQVVQKNGVPHRFCQQVHALRCAVLGM